MRGARVLVKVTRSGKARARVRQDARAAAVVMPFAKVAARVVLNGSIDHNRDNAPGDQWINGQRKLTREQWREKKAEEYGY